MASVIGERIADGQRRIPQAQPDEWGEIAAASDIATGELMARLDAEERAVGQDPWRNGRGLVREPARGATAFRILTRDEAIGALHHVLAVPPTRTVRGILRRAVARNVTYRPVSNH
jgi:hypothetical protein